jgi:hypothetical protein
MTTRRGCGGCALLRSYFIFLLEIAPRRIVDFGVVTPTFGKAENVK